jgi:dTDP-4-dehydrorhamnose 3,5-epimerase
VRLVPTALTAVVVVEPEPSADERGFFARTFDADVFRDHGLKPTVAQANLSYNHCAGTLRGLHLQLPPAAETKLVRCTAGAVWDVVVDLRPDSPTRFDHVAIEISAENRRGVYIPELFAHGFLTLTDGAEVAYQMGEFYTPGHAAGLRWDDPGLGIAWPRPVEVVSERDRAWPLLGERGDPLGPPAPPVLPQ